MSVWENLSGIDKGKSTTRDRQKKIPGLSAPAGDSPRALRHYTKFLPPGSFQSGVESVVVGFAFCGLIRGSGSHPSRKAGGPISFQRERGWSGREPVRRFAEL